KHLYGSLVSQASWGSSASTAKLGAGSFAGSTSTENRALRLRVRRIKKSKKLLRVNRNGVYRSAPAAIMYMNQLMSLSFILARSRFVSVSALGGLSVTIFEQSGSPGKPSSSCPHGAAYSGGGRSNMPP